LKIPAPHGAESTLTENVASPFHAEPRHYKVLRCFSEHTEFEQFEDTLSHCDFSSVSVFRSSRFQADRAREQVNLLDVHIHIFRSSPTLQPVAGTVLVGMTTTGPTPTIHKAWFMDNLHDGDKVLFAAKCDMKHAQHRCEFWLPDPSKPGKEISTMGGFSPAVAQTNTTSLCGMGKLSASVEAQVCPKAEPQAAVAPVMQSAVAESPAPAVQPIAAKPAVVQPSVHTPACKSVMTDANGYETCMDQ